MFREVTDSCLFDAGLEQLAVKHGGRKPSSKWIDQMLEKLGPFESTLEDERIKAQVNSLSFTSIQDCIRSWKRQKCCRPMSCAYLFRN